MEKEATYKPKMGRPKNPIRGQQVCVYLTKDARAKGRMQAVEAGISLSKHIENLIMGAK